MDAIIRKARVKDLFAIVDLIRVATRHGKILKRSRADVRKALRHFWVAEEEGRLVGCVSLEIYNKKLAEVRSLAVAPEKRRKGIGGALVDQCLREARRRKIYEVLAITDRETMFRKRGFSEQLHGQKALFSRPSHIA